MFTFIIQVMDLLKGRGVGLFLLFFIIAWTTYAIKLLRRRKYTPQVGVSPKLTTSIIVPVFYEDMEIWKQTLENLKKYAKDSEIIIVANGRENGEATYAKSQGFKILSLPKASKREAVVAGAKALKTDVTFILDSDTWLSADSIEDMLIPFSDEKVGGATPKQEIFSRNPVMRRIADWIEDLRFHNTVMQQSVGDAVACLPGRMLAIRTYLLKDASYDFLNEKFLGIKCVTGDDRFLTSWLLRNGYKTVYQSSVVVKTDSPVSLKRFVQQRLRWSRSSFRESLLSIPWIWKHPYTTWNVFIDIFIRWFYFAVLVFALFTHHSHFLHLTRWEIILGSLLGFVISGVLRQVDHLRRYPEDLKYLPVFLIVTTFILMPVEWFGNITCFKNSWMTR